MKYRHIGRYGLRVSEIGLGGWLTHGRMLDRAATAALVRRAFDLGVNLFDTADVYAKGEGERHLGEAIKDLRREDLVIATKCFWPMTEGPNDQGLSRKHILESIEGSLSRLQLEYIDLYQFHRYDASTPLDETIRAIDDAIRQGKVLYWGVSSWSAAQIVDACHVARSLNAHPPISNQPCYNLLTRGIETEVMPVCAREGMGVLAFSPLAQGALTGKYKPGGTPPAGSRGADEKARIFMTHYLQDDVLEGIQQVVGIASEVGCSPAQFALAWCLRKPQVSSAIIGATSIEQLEHNIAAVDAQISPVLFAKAEEVVSC